MAQSRHFSMLREFHLADFLTLANAACGVAGCSARWRTCEARDRLLLLGRGAGARRVRIRRAWTAASRAARHTHSALGRELDSLADVISFGVAPAALGFAAGLSGGWDWVVLIYFVCCGVSRLARFNVTAEALSKDDSGKVAYFEGTPIPTSVVLTAVLAFAAWQGRIGEQIYGGAWTLGPWTLHPLVLLYALSGSLMISKTLRIPKL